MGARGGRRGARLARSIPAMPASYAQTGTRRWGRTEGGRVDGAGAARLVSRRVRRRALDRASSVSHVCVIDAAARARAGIAAESHPPEIPASKPWTFDAALMFAHVLRTSAQAVPGRVHINPHARAPCAFCGTRYALRPPVPITSPHVRN
ncbi:hypothetical protein BC628DRAFT_1392987 [Trametes gibbosa]|nr:hypothetical protein BC628DRAFT_1392987 [Trametes gibbosa]